MWNRSRAIKLHVQLFKKIEKKGGKRDRPDLESGGWLCL